MTKKKDMEKRIDASEPEMNRPEKLVELLQTMWVGRMTSDQPITTVATISHIAVGSTPSQAKELLDELISMGLVEEFCPAKQNCNQFMRCGRNTVLQRRYRLTGAAVSIYEQ